MAGNTTVSDDRHNSVIINHYGESRLRIFDGGHCYVDMETKNGFLNVWRTLPKLSERDQQVVDTWKSVAKQLASPAPIPLSS